MSYPKKILQSKISDPRKSFDHSRQLKSGVPPTTPSPSPTPGPQPTLLDYSILFFSAQTGFFECEYPFIDNLMVITVHAVASTRLLGLGSKLYPSNMPYRLNKDLTLYSIHADKETRYEQLLPSLLRVFFKYAKNRASARKPLLVGCHLPKPRTDRFVHVNGKQPLGTALQSTDPRLPITDSEALMCKTSHDVPKTLGILDPTTRQRRDSNENVV